MEAKPQRERFNLDVPQIGQDKEARQTRNFLGVIAEMLPLLTM